MTSFRGGGQRNVWRHLGGGSEKCVTSFRGGQRFVTVCDRGGQKSPKIAWRHLWTAPWWGCTTCLWTNNAGSDAMQQLDGVLHHVHYSNFSVGSLSQYSRLSVGGYYGLAGEALKYNSGRQFTTYDFDRDAYGGNCALQLGGGFWHRNCAYAHITSSTPANTFFWNAGYQLSAVEISLIC